MSFKYHLPPNHSGPNPIGQPVYGSSCREEEHIKRLIRMIGTALSTEVTDQWVEQEVIEFGWPKVKKAHLHSFSWQDKIYSCYHSLEALYELLSSIGLDSSLFQAAIEQSGVYDIKLMPYQAEAYTRVSQAPVRLVFFHLEDETIYDVEGNVLVHPHPDLIREANKENGLYGYELMVRQYGEYGWEQ